MFNFKTKLAITNKLLKMYYFELDTTPKADADYRKLLEIRIAKIERSRDTLINGTSYKSESALLLNQLNEI